MNGTDCNAPHWCLSRSFSHSDRVASFSLVLSSLREFGLLSLEHGRVRSVSGFREGCEASRYQGSFAFLWNWFFVVVLNVDLFVLVLRLDTCLRWFVHVRLILDCSCGGHPMRWTLKFVRFFFSYYSVFGCREFEWKYRRKWSLLLICWYSFRFSSSWK